MGDFNNWRGVTLLPITSKVSPRSSIQDWLKRWTGSEINFFQQAPTGYRNFFQSPNGKMWSPKSIGETFPLQRNTSENYWSPQACQQNICNRCNQESKQCRNYLLTTLTDLHCHLLMPKEYLNLHLI